MKTFGQAYLEWVRNLRFPASVPCGITVLEPYRNSAVLSAISRFCAKYYDDPHPRIGIFGINPGRFGAGITGLSFTDPHALRFYCGIEHTLGNGRELSATFVYQTIDAFGGVKKFFRLFYLSALSPLGFARDGKNLNFYDEPALERVVLPFIVQSLREQCDFPLYRHIAIVFGSGTVRRIAERLNSEHRFFEDLLFVEHPRFIMQYRRRRLSEYITRYVQTYHEALKRCGIEE
ncbi:MAG: DUF4918 family protein [Bacteroidota bacterium]|nr:DUF4918 family protein [Candidatus Kapabacteria bacterium]MDW8271705.1 DUF4918 family protein [Bacteroidota bacterium]